MKREVWKDIAGYEGLYSVSNKGRIKSYETVTIRNGRKYVKKESILKPLINSKRKYAFVNLKKDKKGKWMTIHRLVYCTFTNYKCIKGLVIDHKDNNPLNNELNNLQQITVRHNAKKDNWGRFMKGVSASNRKKNPYRATMTVANKTKHLGSFQTEIEAHDAYIDEFKRIEYENKIWQ